MIVSKNRSGFTLIETLLALALFSMTILPLFRLQTQLLLGVSSFSFRMHRIMLMKNFIYEARKVLREKEEVTQFVLEKKIVDPETRKSYTLEPLSEKSVLKHTKALYREQVIAEWQEGGRKQEETLVQILLDFATL